MTNEIIRLIPIAILDLMMIGVTLGGAIFTLIKISKKKFQLIRRDWVLLGMYWSYSLFILLVFLLEYIVYIQSDLEFCYIYMDFNHKACRLPVYMACNLMEQWL